MFYSDESGAVTVDWVVLTAGLVGLGLATMSVVSAGVEDASGDTSDRLKSTLIATSFDKMANRTYYEQITLGLNDPDFGGFYSPEADPEVLYAAVLGEYAEATDTELQAQIALFDALGTDEPAAQADFQTALNNFDPNNPDYSDFRKFVGHKFHYDETQFNNWMADNMTDLGGPAAGMPLFAADQGPLIGSSIAQRELLDNEIEKRGL